LKTHPHPLPSEAGLDLGYPRKQASDERNMFVVDGDVDFPAMSYGQR